MRGIVAIVLWSALSGSALAQSAPDAAGVRQRLHSASPSEVAWAAFDAGTFQIKEAVPDLVAVLNSPPAGPENERDYLVAAALDALIQIHALPDRSLVPVIAPANAPTRYYARWPVQTLILLDRSGPDAGPILLKLLRGATGDYWYAVANLLLPRSQSGFAAELLNGLRLELRAAVMDTERNVGGAVSNDTGIGGIPGAGENPRGFPPHAIYGMMPIPLAGEVVLSTGPRPLYYFRFVTTESHFDIIRPLGGEPTSAERLQYLEAMVHGQYFFKLNGKTSVSIGWRDTQFVATRISEERKKIADAYDQMLDRLSEGGYLTAEEARARPMDLKIEVIDLRTDRSRPFPDVSATSR